MFYSRFNYALFIQFSLCFIDKSGDLHTYLCFILFHVSALLPLEWESNENDAGYKLILLDSRSPEYGKVHDAAILTSPGAQIIQVWYINNVDIHYCVILAC